MREFKGKTVLITGGAGGLGMGFAQLAAERQMNVVLADIQADALDQAVAELEERQCPVLAILTDTRQRDHYESLLDSARSRFGNIHLFFNNAGVVNGGNPVPIWELPDADWTWVMGVNFYGVLNGLQTVVPHMVEHGEEGHVVNTASIASFIPGGGPYGVSKFGVIHISEALSLDLKKLGSRIGASVLCPGWVNTGIGEAERNRPADLKSKVNPDGSGLGIQQLLAGSKTPQDLASHVYEAIENNQFYIFPHEGWDYMVRGHTEAMLDRGGVYDFDLQAHIASRADGKDI
ncbi:MAG: SDR family NAD(P)-dependent oxidoreductase [Pseudomonadales bacterium]|nr:SDR family NAD(P)-dependent oxidoreductase [Pseudomonadales bacterium]